MSIFSPLYHRKMYLSIDFAQIITFLVYFWRKKMHYERFREIRRDHNCMQKQIADALGIAVTQYSRYERGTQEFPFHLAIKFAKWFNISLDYLSGASDQKRPLDEDLERRQQEEIEALIRSEQQYYDEEERNTAKNADEEDLVTIAEEIKILTAQNEKIQQILRGLSKEELLKIMKSLPD